MGFPVKDWGSCLVGGSDGVATLACVPILLINLINALIAFAGIVAMFIIAWSGFKYITSRGDQARLDSARKTFLWAVVGLIFIFFSYFLVSLIGNVTGVNQIPH
jgi:heme O synthase-like polyprenyltransferase